MTLCSRRKTGADSGTTIYGQISLRCSNARAFRERVRNFVHTNFVYTNLNFMTPSNPAGQGIPSRPSLAYNLSNSQWYIQWLRTLRNRGTERVPIRSKAGRRINADRLFLYGYRRRGSF
jgi:hypothetical protein